MKFQHRMIESPVGPLKIIAHEEGLVALLWGSHDSRKIDFEKSELDDQTNPVLNETATQLREYFAGQRQEFSIALAPQGTEFQKKVWAQLRGLKFGETASYKDLAIRLKNPNASRAVGSANRMNPISILVPCHRVIGASGALTGFAGGMKAKAFLLDLEKKSLRGS